MQEWYEVLDVDESELLESGPEPRGQVLQITEDVLITTYRLCFIVFNVCCIAFHCVSWFVHGIYRYLQNKTIKIMQITAAFLGGGSGVSHITPPHPISMENMRFELAQRHRTTSTMNFFNFRKIWSQDEFKTYSVYVYV